MIHVYTLHYGRASTVCADTRKPCNPYARHIATLTHAEARRILEIGPGEDSGFTPAEVDAIAGVV